MNLHSDLPFWTVKSGLLYTYPSLDRDIRCDALIVGGGITGALMAHTLVEAGVDCVVLDRRDIGQGSTSASTALLQYEIDTPLYKLTGLHDKETAERAYWLGVEAIADLGKLAGNHCGFVRRPSLLLARSKNDVPGLKREFIARKQAGLQVEWLDAPELKRDLGIPRAAAILSSDAAECDPYRLTHFLLQSAMKKGLKVYDRTEADSYIPSKNTIRVSTNRGRKVTAKSIIFASGYESLDLLQTPIVRLSSTYAFVTEPVADLSWWKDRMLIWETGDAYLYSRTCDDGRVLIGGGDDKAVNAARRDRRIPNKTKELMERFQSVYPRFLVEPAYAWAGTFGSTKDGLAYIGPHPAFPRGYFALGFGGNGITFSMIAARIVTGLLLGHRVPDARIFRFDR